MLALTESKPERERAEGERSCCVCHGVCILTKLTVKPNTERAIEREARWTLAEISLAEKISTLMVRLQSPACAEHWRRKAQA